MIEEFVAMVFQGNEYGGLLRELNPGGTLFFSPFFEWKDEGGIESLG